MPVEGFKDVSELTRAGVYILTLGGRVVFVGQAKTMNTRIYAHKTQRRGEPCPAWLPAQPVLFDGVQVRACAVEDLAATYTDALEATGWEPSRPVFAERKRA